MRQVLENMSSSFMQTLVELLEHSSCCHTLQCTQENGGCTEMKQLIHHMLLCNQGTCKICLEINALIQAHANNCNLTLCSVITCTALRQYALYKERGDNTLQSLSDDSKALENVKLKCKGRHGENRVRVRPIYHCGQCGKPKIRPHKCADETVLPTEDSCLPCTETLVNPQSMRNVPERKAEYFSRKSQFKNTTSKRSAPSITLIKKRDLPAQSRSRALFVHRQVSNDTEDEQEPTVCSRSLASRKRPLSVEDSLSLPGPARQRVENVNAYDVKTEYLVRGVDNHSTQLSRCPSFASELSEESSPSFYSEEDSTSDESEPCPRASQSSCVEHTVPFHPQSTAYLPPPPPAFCWLPPPNAAFLPPPSFESHSMFQGQGPCWGPPPSYSLPPPQFSTDVVGSESQSRAYTPLRASSFRRCVANSRKSANPESFSDQNAWLTRCASGTGHLHHSLRERSMEHTDTNTDLSLDTTDAPTNLTASNTSAAAAVRTEEELGLDAFALDLSVSFTSLSPRGGSGGIMAAGILTGAVGRSCGGRECEEIFKNLNSELVTTFSWDERIHVE